MLRIADVHAALRQGQPVVVANVTQGFDAPTTIVLSERQVDVLLAGGLLNLIKSRS